MEVIKREKSAISKGTDIKVKNLFYNTPARKKFLKSPSQELRNITKIVKRFILSYPNVSFMYKTDDKVVYKLKLLFVDGPKLVLNLPKYNSRFLDNKEIPP